MRGQRTRQGTGLGPCGDSQRKLWREVRHSVGRLAQHAIANMEVARDGLSVQGWLALRLLAGTGGGSRGRSKHAGALLRFVPAAAQDGMPRAVGTACPPPLDTQARVPVQLKRHQGIAEAWLRRLPRQHHLRAADIKREVALKQRSIHVHAKGACDKQGVSGQLAAPHLC